MDSVEGVIKFRADHTLAPLSPSVCDVVTRLAGWRDILFRLQMLGVDPQRYGGAAYGNVSARLAPFPGERGARPFVVSATQTGGRDVVVCGGDYALVSAWSIRNNSVVSRGPALPSSESMTHGAVYDVSPTIRAILHVHEPRIFAVVDALKLPATAEGVDYGTPEMASEVGRLWKTSALPERRVFAMLGHEDGIVAFGKDVDAAGAALLTTLAAAINVGHSGPLRADQRRAKRT